MKSKPLSFLTLCAIAASLAVAVINGVGFGSPRSAVWYGERRSLPPRRALPRRRLLLAPWWRPAGQGRGEKTKPLLVSVVETLSGGGLSGWATLLRLTAFRETQGRGGEGFTPESVTTH